jgi:hypothetical protein
MGWLSMEVVGVFGVPVPGALSLELGLVVSGSSVVNSVLVIVAVSEAVLVGWHWVPCRQAQSSRIV